MSYLGGFDTGGTKISQGTTLERLAFEGCIRINTTTGFLEYYNGGVWNSPSITISSTQIAYGISTNGIGGNANFTYDSAANALTLGNTPFTGSKLHIDNTVAGYMQANIQNDSNNTAASSDWVATSNNGSDITGYIDMGINSNSYNQAAFDIGGFSDAYLYSVADLGGLGGNLAIGTATATKNIIFHTGGTTLTQERASIRDTGLVIGTRASVTTPLGLIHIDNATSATTGIRFTNSTTGRTSTDGFSVFLNTAAGAARIWNYEAQTLEFGTSNTARYTIASAGTHAFVSSSNPGVALATFTATASTSGNTPFITFTAAAHTNQTLSAETIDFNFNASATLQHATGALTTQRSFLIQARTYSFVGASVITNSATLAITNAPIAGTNATITNSWALWIQAGNSRFDGTEVQLRHLRGTTTAPTIAAGVGAGTTPTVSVTGTDIAGLVNITTGTTPTGTNAIVATVTFNTAYTTAPYIILTPANRNAQALAIGSIVLVPAAGQTNGVTTTTFVIESGATALAASTAYIWSYQVIQ